MLLPPDWKQPLSMAPFKQDDFLERIYKVCLVEETFKYDGLVESIYEKHQVNERGICVALCLEWYDALKRGKNFIDMMNESKQLDPFYADELLKVQNRFKSLYVGLHLILVSTQDENDTQSHAIAWSKVEKGYSIFDPNLGELFFDNYGSMCGYLGTLLHQYGNNENQAIITRDFYSREDRASIANYSAPPPKLSGAP